MKHGRFTGLVVVLGALAVSMVGCVTAEKYKALENQYAELNTKYNAATEKNKGLQMQVAELEGDKSKLQSALDTAKSDLLAAEGARTKMTPGGVPIRKGNGETEVHKSVLGSDLLFSAGRATLTEAGKGELSKIASMIKSSYSGMTVRVYGHTDSDPIVKTKNLWQDNLDLSANRAMAVTRYLISKGISAQHIETVAMGDAKPDAPNTTKAGKAKNRRVEIIVVK